MRSQAVEAAGFDEGGPLSKLPVEEKGVADHQEEKIVNSS